MSEYEDISLEIDDGAATVVLDRPAKMNTITPTMKTEVRDVLDRLSANDDVRVLVVRGRKNVFCAGADVSDDEDGESTIAETLQRRRDARQFYTAIEEFRLPTIAAIEGYALGGGCEIACACDTRIAVRDAKIGVPEIQIGAIPAGGGTQRLARLVGLSRAKDMILRGKHYTAEEMERFGFVHELTDEDGFDEVLAEVVDQYRNRPPIAIEIGKELVTKGYESSLEGGLLMESLGASIVGETDDAEEGKRAFRENRDPEFDGR